ncbi:envelope stress response activation lipoprotein NlpE [Edwardsiella piscicida]|uniref:envelope stress response activation lipoprotein NlpE n=1 Tax=Edwardsiella piscicida TaxID=1263550 RepID=UPI001CED6A23|nr:envelope stress response activation lipoprotein NlpE [Edwardsiella piscicida]AOP42242.2 envelope stress response activation lipoprotein NlpE [Edwardsiella piscicida]
MKKLAISLLLAAGVITLFGCHARTQYAEQPLVPMAQSFQGTLPCADCGGMEMSLFLDKDGSFVLKSIYRASRDGDQSFAEYGRWQRTADRLVLIGSDGEKRYFRPVGNDMRLLDASGNEIDSPFNYTLRAATSPPPVTAMNVKGMYRYMADAATFHDCATDNVYPVSNTIELEQAYINARPAPGQAVYVEMKGHFAVLPSMEEGQVEKTLVPDGEARFDARGRRR